MYSQVDFVWTQEFNFEIVLRGARKYFGRRAKFKTKGPSFDWIEKIAVKVHSLTTRKTLFLAEVN